MYERKVSKDNELPLEVLLEVQIHTVTRVDSFLHLHAHFTNQNFLCNSVYEKKKCCITRILSSVDSSIFLSRINSKNFPRRKQKMVSNEIVTLWRSSTEFESASKGGYFVLWGFNCSITLSNLMWYLSFITNGKTK